MITNEINVFQNHENVKRTLGNHEELAHHGMSVMVWLNAIWNSRSAEQHSKSVEWCTLQLPSGT